MLTLFLRRRLATGSAAGTAYDLISCFSGTWRRIILKLVPDALEPPKSVPALSPFGARVPWARSPGARPPCTNRAGFPLRLWPWWSWEWPGGLLRAKPVTVCARTFAPASGAHRRKQKTFYAFVRRRLLTPCFALGYALARAKAGSHKKHFCSRRAAGALGGAGIRPLDPLAATPPASSFSAIFLLTALWSRGLPRPSSALRYAWATKGRWSGRQVGGGLPRKPLARHLWRGRSDRVGHPFTGVQL